jgi:hypothetical protein
LCQLQRVIISYRNRSLFKEKYTVASARDNQSVKFSDGGRRSSDPALGLAVLTILFLHMVNGNRKCKKFRHGPLVHWACGSSGIVARTLAGHRGPLRCADFLTFPGLASASGDSASHKPCVKKTVGRSLRPSRGSWSAGLRKGDGRQARAVRNGGGGWSRRSPSLRRRGRNRRQGVRRGHRYKCRRGSFYPLARARGSACRSIQHATHCRAAPRFVKSGSRVVEGELADTGLIFAARRIFLSVTSWATLFIICPPPLYLGLTRRDTSISVARTHRGSRRNLGPLGHLSSQWRRPSPTTAMSAISPSPREPAMPAAPYGGVVEPTHEAWPDNHS